MSNDYKPALNKGNLHRNNYKELEKHPDYRGSLNVCGQIAELSGWINTNRNGGKYLGLELTPPEGYVFILVSDDDQIDTPPTQKAEVVIEEDMPF